MVTYSTKPRYPDPIQPPFFCSECWSPVSYTDENDYSCPKHGFVNAVTKDGKLLSGDGQCGARRVIGRVETKIVLE